VVTNEDQVQEILNTHANEVVLLNVYYLTLVVSQVAFSIIALCYFTKQQLSTKMQFISN